VTCGDEWNAHKATSILCIFAVVNLVVVACTVTVSTWFPYLMMMIDFRQTCMTLRDVSRNLVPIGRAICHSDWLAYKFYIDISGPAYLRRLARPTPAESDKSFSTAPVHFTVFVQQVFCNATVRRQHCRLTRDRAAVRPSGRCRFLPGNVSRACT